MREDSLVILAGSNAYKKVRDQGLKKEDIHVIAGAAGGPKWLVLNGLDRAIFFSWLGGSKRERPLFLIGSSIGTWRFAAIAQRHAEDAYNMFQDAYINQSYSQRPTPEEVSQEARRMLSAYLDQKGIEDILANPYMRINIMATLSRPIVSMENTKLLWPPVVAAALLNAVNRKYIGLFFERTLFYDKRDRPPFFSMNAFPIHRVPLSEKNLRQAILASGSIPIVMQGIKDIPGAPPGMYRDGGIIDYHLDIPFTKDTNSIVLFPHYMGRVTPGWFDKHLKFRGPDPIHMENVLLLCPSRSFIERLPYSKIPTRDDFKLFKGRDSQRIRYWERVVEESKRLGDEFLDAVEKGTIRDKVKKLGARNQAPGAGHQAPGKTGYWV